jgi:hypothetical protein
MKEPMALTRCTHCNAEVSVEYVRLGACVECRNCLKTFVAEMSVGGMYPTTEWHMTFQNFRQLIGEGSYRSAVEPMFELWFNYRLEGSGAGTLVLNEGGEAIDQLWLHLRIQNDAEKQHRIYQVAMSLWR